MKKPPCVLSDKRRICHSAWFVKGNTQRKHHFRRRKLHGFSKSQMERTEEKHQAEKQTKSLFHVTILPLFWFWPREGRGSHLNYCEKFYHNQLIDMNACSCTTLTAAGSYSVPAIALQDPIITKANATRKHQKRAVRSCFIKKTSVPFDDLSSSKVFQAKSHPFENANSKRTDSHL